MAFGFSPSQCSAFMSFLVVETSLTPKQVEETQQLVQKLTAQIGQRAGFEVASGYLHLRRHDLKTAESEVKHAIALDPKLSAAYQVLGTVYQTQNDAKQAFKTA